MAAEGQSKVAEKGQFAGADPVGYVLPPINETAPDQEGTLCLMRDDESSVPILFIFA